MDQLAASQASSHFSLEPISAAVLAERERARRDGLKALGTCTTGCGDMDDYVLLGGFERGCVTGISAEDEDMGLQLGLQTLAHSLCGGAIARALVVTPRPATALLGALRSAFRAELVARGVAAGDVDARTRSCLDGVLLSCVFDLDGLWEVLADLDRPASSAPAPAPAPAPADDDDDDDSKERGAQGDEPAAVVEIQDSEDEDEELSEPADEPTLQQQQQQQQQQSLPDLVVVTHFSTLLTGLFTHREKAAAHEALQLLASHLRYLTRNLATSPLMLLLNSTTPEDQHPQQQQHQQQQQQQQYRKPLDPTLRSIFHPPPTTLPGHPGHPGAGAAGVRRHKPSFGLVFAQLLDVHLLSTRVPRAKDDADAIFAGGGGGGGSRGSARFVHVVEVLLDEAGVWEGRQGRRTSREQRWGAVTVRDGRVREAFGEGERAAGEARLAAGSGEPRG